MQAKKGTVAELLDAWLQHIEHLGRSPSTLYGYRRLVTQLPTGFRQQQLTRVTPKLVDDLYRFLSRETDRKPATVLRCHALLRAAFAQAVRRGWLNRNPIERATPPRVHYAETLRWSDLALDGAVPRILIRRAVLDIDRQRIVQETETHALRWIGIDRGTAELLRRHREEVFEAAEAAKAPVTPDEFVFRRKPASKEPMPPNRIGQAWRRLCEQAGVDARLHDLRHLQASLLLDAGEAITTVSARLGHRDTSTTLRIYSHLMPGADQRAAGIVGKALEGRHDDYSSPSVSS